MASQSIRTGTAYFPNLWHAAKYYRDYGLTTADVRRKVSESEIHLGTPRTKPGQRLVLVDGGNRWAIEEVANG